MANANGQPGSQRREQAGLRDRLRGEGRTWVEVAVEFHQRYRLNARVAFRLAHGWSQQQAAEEWNKRWPDDPKSLKVISLWELWPGSTGIQPSLVTLGRLARLYQCRVSDLLADLPDHRSLDDAQAAPRHPTSVPAGQPDPLGSSRDVAAALSGLLQDHRRLPEVRVDELAGEIMSWLQRFNPNVSRREVLAKLSAAMTVAAAAPLLDASDADRQERLSRALRDPSRVDAATLRCYEHTVDSLGQQKNVLGAQLTLQSALNHRGILRRAAKSAPAKHTLRALSAYARLTDLIGWLCTDMCDYTAAQYYFDDARRAAHEAQNLDLLAYVLGNMTHMACWQGSPRAGVDHALAAQVWAAKTGSPQASAYAETSLAEAFAADRQIAECRKAQDNAQAAMAEFASAGSGSPWWSFYDESYPLAARTRCAVLAGDSKEAADLATMSLTLIDPANLYRYASVKLWRSEALIRQREVAEACCAISEVAAMAGKSMWQRIDQQIDSLRAALTPWQRSRPVRELDEALAVYRGTGDWG